MARIQSYKIYFVVVLSFECVQAAKLDDIKLLLKYGTRPHIKGYENGLACWDIAKIFPTIWHLFSIREMKKAGKERKLLKEASGGCLMLCG